MGTGGDDKVQARFAVWVDLSRSRAAGRLAGLEPDDVFHTTDGRIALSSSRLRGYDVLVIAGNMADSYSAAEKRAIADFVRAGGGLLLAGSAGTFQRYTARPAEDMAVSAIAGLFGVEFLSPSEARGVRRLNADLVEGYPSETAAVRRSRYTRGLDRRDVRPDSWSPVRGRDGRPGEAFIEHETTGEAAALAVPFGKGRVVAIGDVTFLGENLDFCRRLLEALAGGGRRSASRRQLPHAIRSERRKRRRGQIEVLYDEQTAGSVGAALRLAGKVLPCVLRLTARKEFEKATLDLMADCGERGARWSGSAKTAYFRLNVEATEPERAFAMGAALAGNFMWSAGWGRTLFSTVLGQRALPDFVGLIAMREAGFEAEAARLGEALEADSRRRFEGLDAGWYYSEGAEAPGLFIWRELARMHGEDILPRFFKLLPEKPAWDFAPGAVFTSLDLVIHYLSRAARTDLYPWFAGLGATVHPLPLSKFGSETFRRGVRRYLEGRLSESGVAASERLDALEALVALEEKDKRTLSDAARALRGRDRGRRLVAAVRLAKARDQRGVAALRRAAADRADAVQAALALFFLATQGVREAGDPLAELAGRMDVRFQLDAGSQLQRLGHKAAGRFAFEGIGSRLGPEAARMDVEYRSEVRVFPVVNGHRVANVWSSGRPVHLPGNTHVSLYFVHWVHTSAKFRRKSMARLAFQRCMEDARAKRCSCFALFTGTRNVAHSLYRSFGLVDVRVGESLSCDLETTPQARAPKGPQVRRYKPGDEKWTAKVFDRCYAEFFACPRKRVGRFSEEAVTLVARRGGRGVGYVTGRANGKDAYVEELAVVPGKKRQETVRALMVRFHEALRKRGAKAVRMWRGWGEDVAQDLQSLGYVRRRTGGVSLFGILDLAKFLREISPLLGKRNREIGWQGTLALRGQKHRAALDIAGRRVRVLDRAPERADITVSGSDDALTRMLCGAQTALEAYLQLDLEVTPAPTDESQRLLEKLFPRMESYEYYW